MRIVFISGPNPHNRNARSGIPYSIYHQLSIGNEVIWIKPEISGILDKLKLFFIKFFLFFFRRIGYNFLHVPAIVKLENKSIQRKLDMLEYDCIFCMGSTDVAYIKTNKPIFCRADAIAHSFIDYYIFNVPEFGIRWTREVEERALHNYTRFFIPSQWILNEIHKYKICEPDDKFVLVETGANLDSKYVNFPKHSYGVNQELNMLMCGYDLVRKGLNIALDAAKILNEKYKIKTFITVVGGRPSEQMMDSGFIRYVGMKNKNDKKEFDEFYSEFSNADLFIFPTKAECHGIVNCEAAAYGLPIFANDTGGVNSYCIDGENGRCLPVESTGADYAFAIYHAIVNGDMDRYAMNSRILYEQKFNWESWRKKVMPIMKEVVDQ